MRLIEFTKINGDKISVNPREVATVEESKGNTRITLNNEESHTVVEPFVDVVLALEG